MAPNGRSENPQGGQKTSGHPVFSGRIERFADSLSGKDVGAVWSDTAIESDDGVPGRSKFVASTT
jgi:hypothetical protein